MSRGLLAVTVLGLSCVTEYSRRMSPADDPSNPSAPASAMSPIALYETPPADAAHGIHRPKKPPAEPDAGTTTLYACPMHPEVQQTGPGRCPKCGMQLVPMEAR